MQFRLAFVATFLLGLPLSDALAADPAPRLSDTGLYAGLSTTKVREGILSFSPQYPLWSDGASKQRWVELTADAAIDASNPAAWEFPPGTRFWKEFALDGRRVETRLLERHGDGSWRFAVYVWDAAGSDAFLAPEEGIAALPLPDGRSYTIPSIQDCLACHEGAAVPVLGFTALQLSGDRDSLAPHAEPLRPGDVDLTVLAERGHVRSLPPAWLQQPPRIEGVTPAGRAVLGYLHANCSHCHGDPASSAAVVPVPLNLALDPTDPDAAARVLQELLQGAGRYRPPGAADGRFVVAGNPGGGSLLSRMRSHDPRFRMPPLGRSEPDTQAIALIERWIENDLAGLKEASP